MLAVEVNHDLRQASHTRRVQTTPADETSGSGPNQSESSHDPAVQKSWGRKVKNFDKNLWEEHARDVVYTANYAKFTQNKDCLKELIDSGNKIIVEASPTDCIWGVGLRATDPKILDEKNWRGTNWLGEAIMKVRENIKNAKI